MRQIFLKQKLQPLNHVIFFLTNKKIGFAILFLSVFIIISMICYGIFFQGLNFIIPYDSKYYIDTAQKMKEAGFQLKHSYLGYRTYLFPYLVSFVPFHYLQEIGFNVAQAYAFSSMALYIFLGIIAIKLYFKEKNFTLIFCSLFLNPFTIVNLPVLLQESLTVLIVPIAFMALYYSITNNQLKLSFFISGISFAFLYMTRMAYITLLIPYTCVLVTMFYKNQPNANLYSPDTYKFLKLFSLFMLPIIIITFPQSIVSYKNFGTLNPYVLTSPSAIQVTETQKDVGDRVWKYGTIIRTTEDNQFKDGAGLYYNNKIYLKYKESERKSAQEETSIKILSAIGKLFGSLNYDYLVVYANVNDNALLNWHIVLSAIVLFFGASTLLIKIRNRQLELFDFFCLMTIGVLSVLNMMIAPETRFGLIPIILLSYQALCFNRFVSKDQRSILLIAFSLFLPLWLLCSALMFQTTL